MKSKMTLVCYAMSTVILAALCLEGRTPVKGQGGRRGAAEKAGTAGSLGKSGGAGRRGGRGVPGGAGGYGGAGGAAATNLFNNVEVQTYGSRFGLIPSQSGQSRRGAPTDSGIRKAVKKFQAAKTEAEKEKAKQDMSSALSGYFDADLKNREQDIAEIEARVKKLHAQIEKRRAAKDKLVELQLTLLINEAEGLGFYSRPSSDGRSLFDGQPSTPRARYGSGRLRRFPSASSTIAPDESNVEATKSEPVPTKAKEEAAKAIDAR